MSLDRWAPAERPALNPMHELFDLSEAVCEEPDLIELASRACSAAIGLLPPVRWASVTTQLDVRPATVAATDVRALILDHAQYRDGEGPALEAIRTGEAAVMTNKSWPPYWAGVRQAADALDVDSSIALPLHAGGGWIGSLNLYGAETLTVPGRIDSSVVAALIQRLERGIDRYLAGHENQSAQGG
jgi:hypothetical protein